MIELIIGIILGFFIGVFMSAKTISRYISIQHEKQTIIEYNGNTYMIIKRRKP